MLNNIVRMIPGRGLETISVSSRAIVQSSIIASAVWAILFAGRHYFGSELVKSAPVLLSRYCENCDCDEGDGSSSRYAYRDPCIRPGTCKQLSDWEWESLSLEPTFHDFKEQVIMSRAHCESVTKKLVPQFTKDFRKVVAKMGHPHPNAFSAGVIGKGNLGIYSNNTLEVPLKDLHAWWNADSSPARKEMRGVFAHEAAHRILKHTEQMNDCAFGCDLPFAEKVIEKEADLYTLRVPEYARGLRDFLKSAFNFEAFFFINEVNYHHCDRRNQSKTCETLFFNWDNHDPAHPPLKERIAYMTDAICTKYPASNLDICQCSTKT